MVIHIVKRGETIYSIALEYGVSPKRLMFDNQIRRPNNLAIGQAILVLIPEIIHNVETGESIYSIAENYGITYIDIIRNNPYLSQNRNINPGDSIVIKYQENKLGNLVVNGFAYPYINRVTLDETLAYLSELSIFSYGFTADGDLIPIYDDFLISRAKEYNVSPMLTLTPRGVDDRFNNALVTAISNNYTARNRLIQNLLTTVKTKGYAGVNVDFEYIMASDGDAYAEFVNELTIVMNENGFVTTVCLAPKTSSNQMGLLYEGINYRKLGQSANSVLLMTYEWGYTYGPPMAVAPINKVKEVLDYAITQIPAEKINMGIPNYGYDWTLPFVRGESEAKIIGNVEAVDIAVRNGAQIKFDETAMSPFFEYIMDGKEHIVWFEDVRSIRTKLITAINYGFRGVGYWNLMRYFRANWLLLNNIANID